MGGRAKKVGSASNCGESPEELKKKCEAQRELLEAQTVKLMREEESRKSSETELRSLLEKAQEAQLEAAGTVEVLREELRNSAGIAAATEEACAHAFANAEGAHGRRISALEASCAEAMRTVHHRSEQQQWHLQAVANTARQQLAQSEQDVARLRVSLHEAASNQAAAEGQIRAELEAERTVIYAQIREQLGALTARPPHSSRLYAAGPPDVANQQIV